MQAKTKGVFIGIILMLPIILLLQNTQVVTVRFLFWQISMSQIILIPLVLVIGFVVGFLIGKKPW
ncbi:MAG TPA: LapA family protein [Candidatus Omnitrophota bacterium]|nr:LapA family protein [Candidatus Omnitrophota bacterium]